MPQLAVLDHEERLEALNLYYYIAWSRGVRRLREPSHRNEVKRKYFWENLALEYNYIFEMDISQ